ncbi:micrococcal nuclease-like nuclease [Beggiatoa alba B18LD]|uniref:Micrococcal nuclease-like nuclease n=1 Tax=Beggiatoa alba B18LD TaxID=395493 RepID=I3CCD6_9GAMM|nr:thermonuclease family protein [Beggiatoa alba]EIJ41279.1 micrococcal nuclease-like nuclease [Beggiatoa alba B18LD]
MKLFNAGSFKLHLNTLFLALLLLSFTSLTACSSNNNVKSNTQMTGIKAAVFSIENGDTLSLLDSKNKLFTVRLAGIDAPENTQPSGLAAKQNLFNLVFDKTVQVVIEKADTRQSIARVYVNKVDISANQVQKGLAWVLTDSTDKNLQTLEKTARAKKVGLWAATNPIAPWDWRAGKRR